MVHTTRVVPLDGRPRLRHDIGQWSGDSRGHWEGDTLVVETSNFSDKRGWRNSTKNMKLVERFTRVDADTLEYEFTVIDPATWTSSWTASIPMQRKRLDAVRVRLPRRKLRHAEHPRRRAAARSGRPQRSLMSLRRRRRPSFLRPLTPMLAKIAKTAKMALARCYEDGCSHRSQEPPGRHPSTTRSVNRSSFAGRRATSLSSCRWPTTSDCDSGNVQSFLELRDEVAAEARTNGAH